jgi:hypothetical protein
MIESDLLELAAVESVPEREGVDRVALITNVGDIEGRLQPAEGERAVLWVFGSGGGLGGPAGGLYTRLGERLARVGVTSLELDYRRPGDLEDCVVDVLFGLAWLEHLGKTQVVLVGHSFGGAVVINAAEDAKTVIGVAALSSQSGGTDAVSRLAGKPVLVLHGEADEVLPVDCARDICERASEPKTLILYPGCRHGLDECREQLDLDLYDWIGMVLSARAVEPS